MKPEKRAVYEAKLEKRGWRAMDGERTFWGHPKLSFRWPFGDALRLEGEVDSKNLQASEILERKLPGISK